MTGVLVSVNNGPVCKAKSTDINPVGIALIMQEKVPNNVPVQVQLTVFSVDRQNTFVINGLTQYCILKGMDGYRVGLVVDNMEPALLRHMESLPVLND